ncbi:HlyD family secretion protein [Spirosoma areae]
MKKSQIYPLSLLLFLWACHGSPVKKEDLQAANTPVIKPNTVNQIVGIGRIEPEGKIVSLAVNSGGVVVKIYKNEGAKVQLGETLLQIDNAVEMARIQQLKSKITTLQSQIRIAENMVSQTQIQRDNRQSYFQRMKNLYEQNAATRQQFEDAQAEYLTQENKYERSIVEVTLAKLKAAETGKEHQTAIAELRKKAVNAPASGQLLEILVQKGGAVELFSTFATFAPDGKTIAVCEVDELFADKIQVGQNAEIHLIGNEQVITSGSVIYASAYLRKKSLFSEKAGDQEDRRVREVKILLTKPEALLYNTRIECRIDTKKTPG